MRSVEEQLKMKKDLINNIEVPEELEDRLRKALDSVERKPESIVRKKPWLMRHKAVAAVLAFVIFFGFYNYDTLAYYGKKIIGYDEITFGSLKDLNEMGMGQEINKSYKFKDGTEVILDGIMMDENKLYVMYRVIGENEDKVMHVGPVHLNGIFQRYNQGSGHGKINDERTEIAWVKEYEPPKFYERNLTLSFEHSNNGGANWETGKIKFKIDRSKAIKRTVKADIDKSIEFQGIQYEFTSLSATPMSTVLKGEITAVTEEGKKLLIPSQNGAERSLEIEVLETYEKDGKLVTEKIDEVGGSLSRNDDKKEFSLEFGGIKHGIKSLAFNIAKIEDMREIDKTIDINSDTSNVRVVPETEELIIKDVKIVDGDTVVTFTGPADVAFDTALMIGDKQIPNASGYPKISYDSQNNSFEKIYRFTGSGSNMQLMFKTLSHETSINKQITIYEEK